MKSSYRPSEVGGGRGGGGAILDRERVVGNYPYRNRHSKRSAAANPAMNSVAATSKSSCELTECKTIN